MAAFFIAYFTGEDLEEIHEWSGYVVGAVVVVRILCGFVGSKQQLEPGEVMRASDSEHEGNDDDSSEREAGDDGEREGALAGIHGALANLLLLIVIAHVGVVLASVVHLENLVRAMLSGRKRAAGAPVLTWVTLPLSGFAWTRGRPRGTALRPERSAISAATAAPR
ncbi:MAG: hypothetical protein FJX56_11125 [Alphaproteobacteria bacterium]|nr:hypothetical protein [Alphaproteobacteria bacterium]